MLEFGLGLFLLLFSCLDGFLVGCFFVFCFNWSIGFWMAMLHSMGKNYHLPSLQTDHMNKFN